MSSISRTSAGRRELGRVLKHRDDDTDFLSMASESETEDVAQRHELEAQIDALMQVERSNTPLQKRIAIGLFRFFALMVLLYCFFVTLSILSSGFSALGSTITSTINQAVANPLAGFVGGVFLTVMLQSSSTTTSLIVIMVTTDTLTVGNAIYPIFGANIGTSVTSTFMALAHVNQRDEFARAVSGATVHDFFNLLSVVIFMPLEIISGLLWDGHGFLAHFSSFLVGTGGGGGQSVKFTSPVKAIVSPLTALIISVDKKVLTGSGDDATVLKTGSIAFGLHESGWSDPAVGVFFIVVGVVLLSITLILLVKLLKATIKGRVAKVIVAVLDFNGYLAILVGIGLTLAVQSSSIVTSTLVPLIGIGVVSLESSFPVTIGSNIGTTCTSFLASLGADNLNGFQISVVHLCFNLLGTLVWFPIPKMRALPLTLAKRLGAAAASRRWIGFAYILGVFFATPGSLLALSLGPVELFWSIVVPLLVIIASMAIYELIRSTKPQWLPANLRTWQWLPSGPRPPQSFPYYPFWCHPWCREAPSTMIGAADGDALHSIGDYDYGYESEESVNNEHVNLRQVSRVDSYGSDSDNQASIGRGMSMGGIVLNNDMLTDGETRLLLNYAEKRKRTQGRSIARPQTF